MKYRKGQVIIIKDPTDKKNLKPIAVGIILEPSKGSSAYNYINKVYFLTEMCGRERTYPANTVFKFLNISWAKGII